MGRQVKLCRGFFLFVALLWGCTTNAYSQLEKIGELIRTGNDAEIFTRAYLKPLPGGMGANLNSGWFTTARTHKTLGFSIQVRGALARVPSSDQSFNVVELKLQHTMLAAGASPITPTAAGKNHPGAEILLKHQGYEIAHFNLPEGTGFEYVPAALIQASVGLAQQTDLLVRFLPPVHIGNYGNLYLYGGGVKHSISQYIADGHLPVHVAILAGYSHMKISGNLDVRPLPKSQPDPNYEGHYDNQYAKNSYDTFTGKLLVSKDLPFISIYAGAGYETSTMDMRLNGDYPIAVNAKGLNQTTTVTDPLSYHENGQNHFSVTGGLKLKLFFFQIFADYTRADYSVINGGVGFSFR